MVQLDYIASSRFSQRHFRLVAIKHSEVTRMTARNVVPGPATRPGGVTRHGAAIYDDPHHDPYHARGKFAEPTVCTGCGATFHHGRWQWMAAPSDANRGLCPACHRIRDRMPAGTVRLSGPYVAKHRNDLLGIVRNAEKHERTEHALARIMSIDDDGEGIVVSTTDVHLPRRIGEALRAAHDGELAFRFAEDEYRISVDWRRE